MPYHPPLTLTPRLIDLASRISEALGRWAAVESAISDPVSDPVKRLLSVLEPNEAIGIQELMRRMSLAHKTHFPTELSQARARSQPPDDDPTGLTQQPDPALPVNGNWRKSPDLNPDHLQT